MKSILNLRVFFILFMTGCASVDLNPEIQGSKVVPKWYRYYAEDMTGKQKAVKVKPLVEKKLGENEYEIHIYSGFGLQVFIAGGHPLRLVVIERKGDSVTSKYFPPCQHGPLIKNHSAEDLWKSLCANDLFTLPDSSEVKNYQLVLDGVSYVIEMKKGDQFRRIMYSNPSYSKTKEGDAVLRIIEKIKSLSAFPTVPCLTKK